MRRWFKIGFDDEGSAFHPVSNEDAFYVSMPHVDDLVELLASATTIKCSFYTGDGNPHNCVGTPHLCKTDPSDLCIGNGDTAGHTYVPKDGFQTHDFSPGDNEGHTFVPGDDIHVIVGSSDIISCLFFGFPDRDGDPAPNILEISGVRPEDG